MPEALLICLVGLAQRLAQRRILSHRSLLASRQRRLFLFACGALADAWMRRQRLGEISLVPLLRQLAALDRLPAHCAA